MHFNVYHLSSIPNKSLILACVTGETNSFGHIAFSKKDRLRIYLFLNTFFLKTLDYLVKMGQFHQRGRRHNEFTVF